MKHLDSKIENRLLLSIRDVNSTQNCKPKDSCPKICSPSCSEGQVCVYKTITECGVCPPTYCMDNKQLRVTSFESNGGGDSSYKKTALIAGLTTGLVVLALVIATVAGFVLYRRRKMRQQKQNDSMRPIPSTPNSSSITPPPIAYLPEDNSAWHQVDYNDPQSPFIIGAQSLQIPHLDSTPDPSIIRRSLNIQSTTTPMVDVKSGLGRASSVKVTKFDKRHIKIPNHSEDDLSETVLRRAISVRKNDNSPTSSMTRVGSTTSTQDIVYAKPKMVRINTVLKRDQHSGLIRKTSIRTVIEDEPKDFYLVPPAATDNNPSQISVQSSTSSHSSSFGDGSITVYLEPPP